MFGLVLGICVAVASLLSIASTTAPAVLNPAIALGLDVSSGHLSVSFVLCLAQLCGSVGASFLFRIVYTFEYESYYVLETPGEGQGFEVVSTKTGASKAVEGDEQC